MCATLDEHGRESGSQLFSHYLSGGRAPRISQLNSINETLEQRLENTKMLITFNSPHRPCGKRGPARATARKPQWNIKMCFISPFYSITFFFCVFPYYSLPSLLSRRLSLRLSPSSYLFLHFAKTNSFLKFIFNLFFQQTSFLVIENVSELVTGEKCRRKGRLWDVAIV